MITPEEGLRYAMSLPVATTNSGNDLLAVLGQNLEIARKFKPMEADEMDALRERCRAFVADGRNERFKTTKFYDGDLGRQQHGYPTAKELPIEAGNLVSLLLAFLIVTWEEAISCFCALMDSVGIRLIITSPY